MDDAAWLRAVTNIESSAIGFTINVFGRPREFLRASNNQKGETYLHVISGPIDVLNHRAQASDRVNSIRQLLVTASRPRKMPRQLVSTGINRSNKTIGDAAVAHVRN